ncbi:AAA family ATPase [Roseibium sp. HPY-6]|uniref:AAA family ATPase n=1 Tax=Roseibium sp. HPY-6 TaxID=3229852 RepID=UPI00338F1CCA
MKLRKLTLRNVRRFAGKTAILGPFGDGLTTITAENESGKSTFFDALHALFFHDYGSGKRELKEMQPYSGGAMRISAEVEIDGAEYLIEKVFNLKKAGSSAMITALATGTVLKQADDAEQWIQQNILTTKKGPVGLLWVRQGTVGVDADAKNAAEGIDARRDVMSSVRGQIDAITGGRQMDNILQRCKQEFDAISTKQDKPKAGSRWKEAEDRVELLREEREKLARSVDALRHDLDMKKRVTARLHELHDPELRQQRKGEIEDAAEALDAAREHDREIQDIDKDLQLLLGEERDLDRDIAIITDVQKRRESVAEAIEEKEHAVSAATHLRSEAQDALNKAQDVISHKEGERRTQIDSLALARQTERKKAKRKRLSALYDLRQQLQEPRKRLEEAEDILQGVEVTKAVVDRLSDLERRRDIAIEKRKIHFSSFVVKGDQSTASIEGTELPNGEPCLIDHPLDVSLPGFGSIFLRPAEGSGQGLENPDALQEELETGLSTLGLDDVKAAWKAHEARQRASQEKQTAQAQVRAMAPDGVEVLEMEWRKLCSELGHPTEKTAPAVSDDLIDGEPTSEAIEKAIADLEDELDELRNGLPALQRYLTEVTGALTEEAVLLKRLRTDKAELVAPADEEQQLQTLNKSKIDKAKKVAEVREALKVLRESAPDLTAAKAAYERVQKADEQDAKEINRHEKELARLNGAIQTQSEGAVEEQLAEVTGKLARAEDRATQFASHAKALKLLVNHLEAARADAQETYFEPIRNELLPLLRQLHAGAEFQIDAERLLIETITRNGVTDRVDVLSGGAFEQIAVLTRLAFAKLFAKQGSHVPIILDDAIVHTDDERISTMFNMLAQVARDQQIIVLSCRTRAFSDLGGERAFITEADEKAEDRCTVA